jgi:excisionase family DNA binding protein
VSNNQEWLVPRLFLSVSDAVEASGLSRSVLYDKLRTGEIPHVKVGARTLIPADGLRAWAERLTQENSSLQSTSA